MIMLKKNGMYSAIMDAFDDERLPFVKGRGVVFGN
jgi:hypothetical protein